jgi:hypothetical protein
MKASTTQHARTGRRLGRLVALAALALPLTAAGNSVEIGQTTVTWGGFIKADAIFSRFSDGRVPQSAGRDFYLPAGIPTSDGSGQSFSVTDFHAKETRLFASMKTQYAGIAVGGHVEFDFIVNQGAGDERITNAYNPGLRRAFVTLDNWLIGQEWTTFQNLGAIPDVLDFVAFPSEGTIFVRQPMLRYSNGGFAIALENTETTLGTGAPASQTQDGVIPDLTLRYVSTFEGGNFAVTGLLRQLRVDELNPAAPNGMKETEVGYGIGLSGKLPLGASDIRFMLTHGDGVGRYLALSAVPDVVVDANGQLDTVSVTNGYIAYRQPWTDKWRSTVTFSYLNAEDTVGLKSLTGYAVNLLYSPVPKITTGVEYRRGEREEENGNDGSLDRVQFSVKYVL